MRFALLEAKMALIEILKRFTFLRAPDTQVHMLERDSYQEFIM
jgi:cytochrome P450